MDIPLNGKQGDELAAATSVIIGGVQPIASPKQKKKKSSKSKGQKHESSESKGQKHEHFAQVVEFLGQHPTAKIVFIVDTHCLEETGLFLWAGQDATNYQTSTLLDVSLHALIYCSYDLNDCPDDPRLCSRVHPPISHRRTGFHGSHAQEPNNKFGLWAFNYAPRIASQDV